MVNLIHDTCPAHYAVIQAWSIGCDSSIHIEDPLPADAGQWLAKITQGSKAEFLQLEESTCGEFEAAEPQTELLRVVESPVAKDTYALYRTGAILSVFVLTTSVSPNPIGHWLRFDLRIADWF